MAAMATAAVSVRVVDTPRDGRCADSSSRSTDSTLTPGSYMVRRAASSASVTSTRQCGTETSVGCSSHVIGFSCSPRSSSSSATWASWAPTMVASAPVGGHQGRGCFSQPAASAPSTKCRRPVNGATCRRPHANAGCSHSLRSSPHASATWSRASITAAVWREDRTAARSQAPAQLPRSASSCAARRRSVSVRRRVHQVRCSRRETRGRPMSPWATRSAQRTIRSSSTEACMAATERSSRSSARSRQASSGMPSTSSPSASSSSTRGTSRTTAGQLTSPSGSTAPRRSATSGRLSSRPVGGWRRGQNRVRL